jgi:hypothetical protein
VNRFLFPKWSDRVPRAILVSLLTVVSGAAVSLWYFGSPKFTDAGYGPVQPVEYSHKLHAGDLGIDCRYCHYTVEKAGFAAVPPTQVCMNCHSKVKTDSQKLLAVRESFAKDAAIPWVKIHRLPDFVFFNHSAHVTAGVGCSSCHGRIDQMPRVAQKEPLSMSWCLDCHRNPGPALRPADKVTEMAWKPSPELALSSAPAMAATGREVHPPTHCSGCHR